MKEQSALSRKLKLKAGANAAVVNAPGGYLDALQPLPEGATIAGKIKGPHDWIQLFCATRADLETLAPVAAGALAPSAMLWLCFPKGTSKLQTDLTRDIGWDVMEQIDLKYVTLVSVNDTWSAFGLRPYKPGEERQPPWSSRRP
jgi:hypothetical protein